MKKGCKRKSNRHHKSVTKKGKKVNYYRDFGTLSDDSVVTDIYNKKFKNEEKTIATKCKVRQMTDEEYEKYFGKK